MHEEPEPTVGVAVELEEVIAAAERPQMTAGERVARVLERACRERRLTKGVGNVRAAPPVGRVADGNRQGQETERLLEEPTVAGIRVGGDADDRHPATEVSPKRAGDHGVLRREDGADGHPLRQMSVGHHRDVVDDVRLDSRAAGTGGPPRWRRTAPRGEPVHAARAPGRRSPGTGALLFSLRDVKGERPVEQEAKVRHSLQVERVGEPRPEKGARPQKRALRLRARTLRVARDDGRREVNACVTVIDGKNGGGDPDARERRVGDVIAQERAKLFEYQTLQSCVPVTGTFFFSSHETRLRCARSAGRDHSAAKGNGGSARPALEAR